MPDLVAREKRLLKTYGIDLADYARLLQWQDGVCAICLKPPPPGKSLAVDHDHAMVSAVKKKERTVMHVRASIRGLLCWLCNHRRIGRGATPEIMDRAAEYLRSAHPTAQTCLDYATV